MVNCSPDEFEKYYKSLHTDYQKLIVGMGGLYLRESKMQEKLKEDLAEVSFFKPEVYRKF